ncbi:hypothetical protein GAPWKB11_1118 [Gilliamella apicola]|nr:hypothetical protein [Gilliamella apicola]KFA59229.1 hypothetical protein GAPWKB11_1118 [Gilliamella apicola]
MVLALLNGQRFDANIIEVALAYADTIERGELITELPTENNAESCLIGGDTLISE